MDIGDKEKFELEKRNDEPMNYHSPSMLLDWRFSAPNLSNVSMGAVPSMAVCKGDIIGSSSSCSTLDSYNPILWDHPNSQNLGYCNINAHNNTSPSSTLGIRNGGPASLRGVVDMGCNHPNSMVKGGVFLPNVPGMIPQSLSQFPADSGFIERAARFSSFSGGSFSEMVNPFCAPEPMAFYSRGVGMVHEAYMENGSKLVPSGQSQKNELNVGEASKNVFVSLENGAVDGSTLKNEGRSESLHDGGKQGVGGSGNESDEAEFSGQDGPSSLEGAGREPSAKEIGLKKQKRKGQDTELDKTEEASQQASDFAKDKAEIQHKGDHNPTAATNKAIGKQGKQGSQASDLAKDEYIHVRARRGQATNSHSLAERVRREKISERMKFLQDLVPGCSKVTGKAVMLDEIINYVQSLQRQVEFLSMKLATVNPRPDVNIERLLAKDILQSRPGPSSSEGYAEDMPVPYPMLHPSQSGIIQAGIGSCNVLRRNINPQLTPLSGGFKEPNQHMWEDEIHNVVQMNFGTSAPLSSPDVNESMTAAQMKTEL